MTLNESPQRAQQMVFEERMNPHAAEPDDFLPPSLSPPSLRTFAAAIICFYGNERMVDKLGLNFPQCPWA
jgi:hypothetical protein